MINSFKKVFENAYAECDNSLWAKYWTNRWQPLKDLAAPEGFNGCRVSIGTEIEAALLRGE